jgi:sialate O-acetylesterase
MKNIIKVMMAIACLSLGSVLQADVKLPALISDNMVLQDNKQVPLWGMADPGEKVTVSFAGQSVSTTADATGKWQVNLTPLAADTVGSMTVEGRNKISIANVLVGTVWVCSGQSNMEMRIGAANNAAAEIAKANYPKIRLFLVKKKASIQPQTDVEGRWVECSPETLPKQGLGFSAVAYFFARDVHLATGLPVGLIQSAWGGTRAEAWTSVSGLQKEPELKVHADSYEKQLQNFPALKEKYIKDSSEYPAKHKAWEETNGPYLQSVKNWYVDSAKAKAEGKPFPAKPSPSNPEPTQGIDPDNNAHIPSALFNGMIAPLIPYAIEGVLWYQGESNSGKPTEYRTLFPNLISDWRQKWGQGDFPFYFCQIASFMSKQTNPVESKQAELREAQRLALRLPNTGMAVLVDIGEAWDVHPGNKQDVGSRLARIALAKLYGKGGRFTGPVYRSMKVEGDKIRLKFDPEGGELTAGMLPEKYPVSTRRNEYLSLARNRAGSQLEGFAICGAERKWVWADAVIDGQTVIVSAPEVKEPVAVRYAWADNPTCNLDNKEGLPASSFQTDDVASPPAPSIKK